MITISTLDNLQVEQNYNYNTILFTNYLTN
jgi:hypothetical protein